jgi:hypothetical protein
MPCAAADHILSKCTAFGSGTSVEIEDRDQTFKVRRSIVKSMIWHREFSKNHRWTERLQSRRPPLKTESHRQQTGRAWPIDALCLILLEAALLVAFQISSAPVLANLLTRRYMPIGKSLQFLLELP